MAVNLNEIQAEARDLAELWAIHREFDLRQRRYSVAREGAIGAMRRLSEALVGLDGAEKASGRGQALRGHGGPPVAATTHSEGRP